MITNQSRNPAIVGVPLASRKSISEPFRFPWG
nr:MAG TPA: hypothetical protein [Caudoviricetes sp.]